MSKCALRKKVYSGGCRCQQTPSAVQERLPGEGSVSFHKLLCLVTLHPLLGRWCCCNAVRAVVYSALVSCGCFLSIAALAGCASSGSSVAAMTWLCSAKLWSYLTSAVQNERAQNGYCRKASFLLTREWFRAECQRRCLLGQMPSLLSHCVCVFGLTCGVGGFACFVMSGLMSIVGSLMFIPFSFALTLSWHRLS